MYLQSNKQKNLIRTKISGIRNTGLQNQGRTENLSIILFSSLHI